MVLGRQLGLPAVLDNDRLMRLDDDGGAFDLMSRAQRVADVDQGAVPFAVGEEPRAARRRRKFCPRRLADFFLEGRAAADRFDRNRLDHQRFAAINKAELRFVRALESGLHLVEGDKLQLPFPLWGGVGGAGREVTHMRQRPRTTPRPPAPTLPRKGGGRRKSARVDDQRRVGAGVAHVCAHMHGDLVCRDALPRDLFGHVAPKLPRHTIERLARLIPERLPRSPAGGRCGCRQGPCRRPRAATTADGSARSSCRARRQPGRRAGRRRRRSS